MGINPTETEKIKKPTPGKGLTLTRREFLKAMELTVGVLALAKKGSETEVSEQKEYLTPYEVHGVEVYGLIDPIKTETQVLTLYAEMDRIFANQQGLSALTRMSYPRRELRREYLPPQERFLEIVVTRSAYNKYLGQVNEGRPDFVEWIQAHIAYLNICLENSKPPSQMRATLRRIIIIEDELANQYYDPAKKGKLGENLDCKWRDNFRSQTRDRFPIDIDTSWAIESPPIYDPAETPFYWDYQLRGGEVTFGFPPGEAQYSQTYVYQINENYFPQRLQSGRIDCGLPHEWSHYLLNLPDEYSFDYNTEELGYTQIKGWRFSSFSFDTGLFHRPQISPYLAMLTNDHIKKGRRTSNQDHFERGYGTFELPKRVEITFTYPSGSSIPNAEKNPYRLYFLEKESPVSRAPVPQATFITPIIDISKELWENSGSDVKLITLTNGDTQVFIPYAIFNMTKMAGQDIARYTVEIMDPKKDISGGKTHQGLELVDETDITKFLDNKIALGDMPYARMHIVGTSTWAFWF